LLHSQDTAVCGPSKGATEVLREHYQRLNCTPQSQLLRKKTGKFVKYSTTVSAYIHRSPICVNSVVYTELN